MRYLLAGLLCLVALMSNGCIAFYTHRDTTVRVLDAETEEPISGVNIDIRYLYMFVLNPPDPVHVSTDAQGFAEARIATFAPVGLSILAPGYLSLDQFFFVTLRDAPPQPPASQFAWKKRNESVGRPTDELTIHLYREPAPSLRIVVPEGYRGPIKIHLVSSTSLIMGQRHQRIFMVHIDEFGDAALCASPLLSPRTLIGDRGDRIQATDGRTEYPLDWRASLPGDGEGGFALRAIELHSGNLILHLGSLAEANAFFKTIHDVTYFNDGGVDIAQTPGGSDRIMARARTLPPQ